MRKVYVASPQAGRKYPQNAFAGSHLVQLPASGTTITPPPPPPPPPPVVVPPVVVPPTPGPPVVPVPPPIFVPIGASGGGWSTGKVKPWRLRPTGRVVSATVVLSGPVTALAASGATFAPAVASAPSEARGRLMSPQTALRAAGQAEHHVSGTARVGRRRSADSDERVALQLLGWED